MHLHTEPQYLCDAIANIRKIVQYNTQNEDKFMHRHVVPKCRLYIYKK